MSNLAAIITAIATLFIAWVYYRTWKQAEESNRPILSVSLKKCEYSEPTELFQMQITVMNHGLVIAQDLDLTFTFAGCGGNPSHRIQRIAIRPHEKLKCSFSLEMNPDTYKVGQTAGNRINVLIEGSYKCTPGNRYEYHERAEYDPRLARFVTSVAW